MVVLPKDTVVNDREAGAESRGPDRRKCVNLHYAGTRPDRPKLQRCVIHDRRYLTSSFVLSPNDSEAEEATGRCRQCDRWGVSHRHVVYHLSLAVSEATKPEKLLAVSLQK